jgi:GNAT superfamily N-acetyltransferase
MMPDASAHPLMRVFEDAAAGQFPDADGGVDVFPELPGPADGLFGFTAHFAVAAPIPPAEVLARIPPGNFSFPMSAPFVTWIAERIGAGPGVLDAVLCARGRGIGAPPWLVPEPDNDHPRVARARRYRHDVTVLRTDTGDGVLVVGRGVCGRWELAFEVEPDARNRGLGRRLIEAGRDIVPAGASVWAQIAPGNAASMRASIAAGFAPVGSEVLFPRAG